MNEDGCFSVVTIALLTFIIGIFVGSMKATKNMELDAIKAGVGQYYIDESNDKSFKWVVNEEINFETKSEENTL